MMMKKVESIAKLKAGKKPIEEVKVDTRDKKKGK